MSEDPYASQEPSQKIIVKVDRTPEQERLLNELEAVRSQRDELQQTLEGLAQAEFEDQKNKLAKKFPEKAEYIRNLETPTELETARTLLSGEKRKSPVGVVSLTPSTPQQQSVLTKEYPDVGSMVQDAMQHEKTEPEIGEAMTRLWRKIGNKTSPKFSITDNMAKVKSASNRYQEYTNSRGFVVYVPVEHSRALSTEQLKKRLDSGYYG